MIYVKTGLKVERSNRNLSGKFQKKDINIKKFRQKIKYQSNSAEKQTRGEN